MNDIKKYLENQNRIRLELLRSLNLSEYNSKEYKEISERIKAHDQRVVDGVRYLSNNPQSEDQSKYLNKQTKSELKHWRFVGIQITLFILLIALGWILFIAKFIREW